MEKGFVSLVHADVVGLQAALCCSIPLLVCAHHFEQASWLCPAVQQLSISELQDGGWMSRKNQLKTQLKNNVATAHALACHCCPCHDPQGFRWSRVLCSTPELPYCTTCHLQQPACSIHLIVFLERREKGTASTLASSSLYLRCHANVVPPPQPPPQPRLTQSLITSLMPWLLEQAALACELRSA